MTETSPRHRTREQLYRLVRNGGELTRSELVALTGISRSTVNQSVGSLLADGRVIEVHTELKGPGSGSGRPAIKLRAMSVAAPVAGIDFGHSHVFVAVADALGQLIGSSQATVDVDLHAAEAMTAALDLLSTVRREHAVSALSSVVAGIPGPVDRQLGLVRSPTILSGWIGLNPAAELRARLGVAVHVENDAVLGAYGELHCGAGRQYSDFLYVKASNGVGASVVIGGQPYRGATGLAGEIGHSQLPGRTEQCRCGNRGCLEAVVGVATIREQIAHTRPGTDPANIDLAGVEDPMAIRILDEAGRTIGQVLADLCNLLNPAAVIVGGELGSCGPHVIDGIAASLRRYAQPATVDALTVVPAALGVRAELTGALELATTLAT